MYIIEMYCTSFVLNIVVVIVSKYNVHTITMYFSKLGVGTSFRVLSLSRVFLLAFGGVVHLLW